MKIFNDFKEMLVIVLLAWDREFLYKLQYFHQRGHFPDLKHPQDLSEILLAEMLKPDFASKYADFADKIKVRQYVKDRGLEDILLKHYGVWDEANKINFDQLPDKFVLKTNNGCGNHVFCKDKSTLDINNSIRLLNKALQLPYSYKREPHYNAINPKIFCEELIYLETDDLPTDYKFHCLNGKPFIILAVTERARNMKISTFDLDWNRLNFTKEKYLPKVFPKKPKNLNKMAEIAKVLSEGFDFVRVDLYDTGKKVLFSELTFTPLGGLLGSFTEEAIKTMGSLYKNQL